MSAEASKTVLGFQFPNGHLGHLSPEQKASFDGFKKLVTDRGVYTPPSEGRLASHGDATLLRFLRARKFQLEPAYKQFIDAEKWASDNRLGELYETIDVEEYDATRKLYPQWVGTRDKRGMPVYLYEIGPLDMKAVFAYEKAKSVKGATGPDRPAAPKMLRVFALYENLCQFTTPWCTALEDRSSPNAPITQGCNIIDIKGTGLKQFWDLKSHLQDSSQLATAYYPETLDKIFIIGAPSFFPSVWGWIKNWFDPVVVSKMFVIPSGQELKILSEHIDHDAIPQRYGGGAKYNFGDLPQIEPSIAQQMTWEGEAGGAKGLPIGPIKWETSADGDMVAVAVGTVEGKARRQVVGRLVGKSYRKTFFRTEEEAQGRVEGGPGVGDDGGVEKEKVGEKDIPAQTGAPTATVAA